MYSWRAKIGLISHPGENMEHAFHLCAPDGVSFCSTKLSAAPTDRDALLCEIRQAAALFRDYPVDVIACGCDFSRLADDKGTDADCRKAAETVSGRPAVTGAEAAVAAMKRLGCGRIGFLSPYGAETEAACMAYLRRKGAEVTESLRMDMTQFDREALPYETADRDFLYKYARSMSLSGAEGLFLCGESLGTMEMVGYLERDLGIPVITSQQALFWAALRQSGVNARVPELGKLLTLGWEGDPNV